MNSSESIDMSKAAIAVLLTCLLIGVTLTLFYRMYNPTARATDNLKKTANSAKMERAYELDNLSRGGKYPLVSNVISCLAEFDGTDLLYIQIEDNNGGKYLFTYDELTLSIINNEGDYTLVNSSVPTVDAAKHLQQYSAKRCNFLVKNVDYNGGSGSMIAFSIWVNN